jgi:hypothetical protein
VGVGRVIGAVGVVGADRASEGGDEAFLGSVAAHPHGVCRHAVLCRHLAQRPGLESGHGDEVCFAAGENPGADRVGQHLIGMPLGPRRHEADEGGAGGGFVGVSRGVPDGWRGQTAVRAPGQTGAVRGPQQDREPLLARGVGPGEGGQETGEDFRLELGAGILVAAGELAGDTVQAGPGHPDRGQCPPPLSRVVRIVVLGASDQLGPYPVLHRDRGVWAGQHLA